MLLAHLRSFLARHRAVHWALVWGVALATAAIVAAQASSLDRERRAWGEARPVWLASADLAPGDLVIAHAEQAPVALVASTAVTDRPVGLIARRSVSAGEVLVSADVGTDDDLVPAGWRRVAVATDESSLRVRPGDRVDVAASGAVLASDGVVVEVTPAAVTVAVPVVAAPSVAAAALERLAVLIAHG
jgi:hypothetical protein